MELLNQLESRITELLDQLDALQKENAVLREQLTNEINTVAEENARLSQELEQERQRNNEAAERVEAIMGRLRERL